MTEWYAFVYRTVYRLGLRLWERASPPGALVDLVEGPSHLPQGRALDIGCGTGTETVYLAAHGWEVTGVDMVPRALSRARRKAARAGVSPRFLEADVTHLGDAAVGDGYTLVVDFGCFHTIPAARRAAYVAGVSNAAAPGATFLLYGFTRPPRLAPIAASISTEEVERWFGGSGWDLLSAGSVPAGEIEPRQGASAQRFGLWSYRLRRAVRGGAEGTLD